MAFFFLSFFELLLTFTYYILSAMKTKLKEQTKSWHSLRCRGTTDLYSGI